MGLQIPRPQGRGMARQLWLLRHGVGVSHGRAYHPQTQGKEERFHRSLKAEVLDRNSFAGLVACQLAFDRWRRIYNHERPHEALGLQPPVLRYRPSPRTFCESLPPIEYGPGDIVRRVDGDGWIAWGAVPTDRPVGESADPHWRHLAEVWCDLTRRGVDPVPLRTRSA
jgi:hypothetical protein